MIDKDFLAFLENSVAEKENQVRAGGLEIEDLMIIVTEINRLKAKIERMHNPRTRKPKVEVAPELQEAA